jgi:hypothetical protein
MASSFALIPEAWAVSLALRSVISESIFLDNTAAAASIALSLVSRTVASS